MMIGKNIGIIKGEGVGPEVIDVAIACLKEIEQITGENFSFIFYSGMSPSTDQDGGEAYASLKEFYLMIKEQGGVILRSSLYANIVYKLREDFNLLYKLMFLDPLPELLGVCPLKDEIARKMRLFLIRDNTQGIYHSQEKLERKANGERVVRLFSMFEEGKIRDIAEVAFRLASRNRNVVHLLIKGDVLKELARLWIEVFDDVNKEYPDVQFDWNHPDPGLAEMLISPQKYDVVVALDVDADIIGDFLSGLVYGTRAITPSGNFDPSSQFATYQTIHGSADALTGRDIVNPIGMVLASAMMLELSFNMPKEANLIRNAVRSVLSQGYRTSDIFTENNAGHKLVGTKEMKEKIVGEIRRLSEVRLQNV